MSNKKSIGGAATNRGIWYQALWCVLHAASARIEQTNESKEPGDHGVRLVLEPLGGDAWVEGAGKRRVIQLKTLSTGTWSINNVVEDVFPDLYRTITPDSPTDITYELITEGGFGAWSEVRDFFESLDKDIGPNSSAAEFNAAYETLDDATQLKFRGSTSEFWESACTQRALFDRIVAHLRTKAPAKKEALDETRRKAWHMLARFLFEGCISEEKQLRDIRETLIPVVHHREDISTVIDAMVGWIIKRSSTNETTIKPAELFEAHNLQYVSTISQWVATKEKCQAHCRRKMGLFGYRREWDVRHSLTKCEINVASAPFVVVCGESGFGKSWWLYAQARIEDGLASVLLESKGDAERDLQRAANRVWQDILGHDNTITLRNLARRQAKVLKRPIDGRWLKICLDGLTSPDAARDLLNQSVEDWGVQLIVACNEQVAQVFEAHERNRQNRVQFVRLDRFTSTERDKYLAQRIGDKWVDLPADVRELLRKPQLADLYCQLFEECGNWQPQNEYELIEEFWKHFDSRDALHLAKLAATLCDDAHYPWYEEQLENAEIVPEGVLRMSSHGWLRRSSGNRYEVPHYRLLNFAVAKGLVVSHRSGSKSDEAIAELLRRMLNSEVFSKNIMLDYVPMDWFFLRLNDDMAVAEDVKTVAEKVLELVAKGLQYHKSEALFSDLLPTLGVAAVRPLINRLIALADAGNWYEMNPVVTGLSTIRADHLRDSIKELLADDRPRVRRAALKVLAQRPMSEFLDEVWQLHVEMKSTPEKFFGADEKTVIWLHEDSFKALRACARLDPGWVVSAVRRANSEKEPVHDLAYLTANLSDGGKTWRACKSELFEKVSLGKQRCLAINIGTWRDASEVHRLESWVEVENDFLGPAALRALAQINPKQAVARMPALSEWHQYSCRKWHVPRLMLLAPDETRDQLHRLVCQSNDPLTTACVFQGFENEIDGRTLDILLDALDEAVATAIGKPQTQFSDNESARFAEADSLYVPMGMLAAIGRRDLLRIFESRQGTRLEERLEYLLTKVIGPRCSLYQDSLIRRPALQMLLKIGGEGHGRVVSAFLDGETRYGKLDAIEEARKNTAREGIEKLRRIALSDVLWDEYPLLQTQSMRTLASLGDGDGVLASALRLGQDVPGDIADWLYPGIQPTAKAIEEAVKIIRDRDTTRLPGALKGLGLFGCAEAASDMIAVLRKPPDSASQIAAIVALGRLGESARAAVDLIGECISKDKLRHVAVVALTRIGTDAAHLRLLASLDNSWDMHRAIRLTQFSVVRAKAIEKITDRLKSIDEHTRTVFRDDVSIFLSQAREEVLSQVLPVLPTIVDRIRDAAFASEGSSWIVGSKAAAIRGLAVIDPHAAFLAARKALENIDSNDRHLYPSLLNRSNAEEARELFLRLAATEKNKAMLWAMAHTIRPDAIPWLFDQLASASTSVKSAACRLAIGIASYDNSISDRLRELLADFDEDVASAAEKSLHLIRRQQQASELVEELDLQDSEAGLKHWVLVDAALQVGDSGYEGAQWPHWAKTLANSKTFKAHPALSAAFQKQIGEKRKKSLQDANR